MPLTSSSTQHQSGAAGLLKKLENLGLSLSLDLNSETKAKRLFTAFLLAHFCVFALIALLTLPTLPLDVVEQASWARDPQWAYFKHPPLPAWCLAALMALTGGAPWITALSGPLSTTLALWILWLLARRIFAPAAALFSILILEGAIQFNVLSLEFNHNVVQLPVWALIAYSGHRALREDRLIDWLLFGVAAALGMLAKYSSALLLISIAAYALYDRSARPKLFSYRPWLAVLVGVGLLVPHVLAVKSYDFYALRFPLDRVQVASYFTDRFLFPLRWLLSQTSDIVAALVLGLCLFSSRSGTQASETERCAAADRRFLMMAFAGPLLLAALFQGMGGVRFKDLWGFPMLNLTGFVILALTAHRPFTAKGLHRFAIAFCAIFALSAVALVTFNIGAPYISHKGGRLSFPSRTMTQAIAQGWSEQTHNRPLRVAIGDNWLAGLLSTYHPDYPSIIIDGDAWKSPWVTQKMLDEQGAVLVWATNDAGRRAKLFAFYPEALEQPTLTLPYDTDAKVPPVQVSWAILLPKPGLAK